MSHLIEATDLSVRYKLFGDRTRSLKEFVTNRLHGRSYGSDGDRKNSHLALDQVSFKIEVGERVGIIGRNGAGKSTLLKVLTGIIAPTGGQTRIDGHIQPLIEVGAGFNPELSGRDNIYLNSYMLGFSRSQVLEKEDEIVAFSELEKFIDTPVKYYSSGMSVRLAFAIATSIQPDILVFDEMLSAGDAFFMEKAKARMDQLVSHARAIVLVSHDLNLIQSFCSRVLVLEGGQVRFDGAAEEAVKIYLSNAEKG